MPAINPIRFVDYVCDPSTIRIEANHHVGSKYIHICSKVSNKVAFEANYIFQLTDKKEEFNEKVKAFCNAILMFTEDEVQHYVDEDKIMPALYTFRHLKEVRSKSGKLIWRRS